MYFQKIVIPDSDADLLPVNTHGRDKGAQDDDSGIEKKPGHFGNPAKVLAPIFDAESQVGTQTVGDILAVENKGSTPMPRNRSSTAWASVDLPKPENPVNQTAQARWPFSRSRRSRVIVAWCQTTLLIVSP